jgi:hypothetical protein
MDTRQAFADMEIDLRRLVRDASRDASGSSEAWLSWPGAPKRESLEKRRLSDGKSRTGTVVSSDLLDYTDFADLVSLVTDNWHAFSPIFTDRGQTSAMLRILERLRDPEAHSRSLLAFEEHLVLGSTGLIRNEIALWRSRSYPATNFYPMIHDIHDQLGNEAPVEASNVSSPVVHRWSIGDSVTLTCRAWSPITQSLRWWALAKPGDVNAYALAELICEVEAGEIGSGEMSFQITIREVSEYFFIRIYMEAQDTPYHLHDNVYDGRAGIAYAVNPPPR